MSKANVYAVGGTVQASGGIYLPRAADDEMLGLCLRGEYVHILTTRQVGKSSLMIRTVQELKRRGVRTAVVDISSFGVDLEEEQWYFSLLKVIRDQLRLEINLLTWWQTNAHINETDRFTTFLREVVLRELSEPVAIFIDEIDTTRVLQFTDDFFIAIRSLYNGRAHQPELKRLSFVLIGVAATPQDLIKTGERTPYNILGTPVELTDFTFDEALPLAAGLGLPEAHARQVLGWVMKWTSGHPYLTLRLCRDIAESGRDTWAEADVDRLVAGTFSEDKNVLDTNLHFVRSMLTTQAPDPEKVLKTYRKVRRGVPPVFDQDRSQTKNHLKLSGIVRRQGRMLRLRNRIYGELFDEKWIREHMPVNWPRRLQRAVVFLIAVMLPSATAAAFLAFSMYREAAQAKAQLEEANCVLEENARQIGEANAELRKAIDAKTAALEEMRQAREGLELTNKKLESTNKDLAAATKKAEAEAEHAKQAEREAVSAKTLAQRNATNATVADAYQAIRRSARELESNETQRALKYLDVAHANLESLPNTAGHHEASSVLRYLYARGLPSLDAQFASIGHERDVSFAAFSPDGKLVVTAGKDSLAKLWNVSEGADGLRELSGHDAQLRYVSFSDDSRQIVTASDDGTARLWDAATAKEIRVLRHSAADNPSTIYHAKFSHGGGLVVTAGADGRVKLWDAKTGKELFEGAGHGGQVFSAEFSPTDKYVVTAGADGTARVWNADVTESPVKLGEAKILRGKPSARAGAEDATVGIYHATFSPDGGFVVTAHLDKIARVWERGRSWETASDEPVHELKGHNAAVYYAAFNHLGDRLVTAGIDGKAIIWDLTDYDKGPRRVSSLGEKDGDGHTSAVLRAEFSGNDKYVVTASVDNSAKIWDVKTGSLLTSLDGHRAPVNTASFSSTGGGEEFVLTASDDGTAKVWKWKESLNTSARLGPQSSGVYSATFSPNGERVVTTGGKIATVWDVKTRKRVSELEQHGGTVFFAAFSHDGERLVTASEDKTAIVWKRSQALTDGAPERYVVSHRLTGHTEHVHHAQFSPDGKLIITASDDTTAIIWDADTGRPLKTLEGHARFIMSACFSDSGKYAVTTSTDGTARVWNVATGKQITELRGHVGRVFAAAFSPNVRGAQAGESDRWVATAGEDGTVRIWDWAKEGEPRVLKVHKGKVYSVAFNHDGSLLLSAGADESAVVSDATTGDRLDTLKPGPGTGDIMWASFSQDGRQIVAGSENGSITLWNFPFLAGGNQKEEQRRIDEMIRRLVLYDADKGGALMQRRYRGVGGDGSRPRGPAGFLWVNEKFKAEPSPGKRAKEGDLN